MTTRVSEALGFVPQKDIVYNQLLPYAGKLDAESNEVLAQIKGNLGRAVQLREIWPGVLFWTRKLSTYIRLYGRKFSKEDHVLFIRLLYELVTLPKLEISMMQGFARLLNSLLKKKELLSRDDLELPWRPLYDLHERILYSKTEHLGLNWFPSSVEVTLKALVKNCRPYFPDSATQEMLDEWRPLLCPFDATMQRAVGYFELFLPTALPPRLHHKGFKLWFDDMIHLWVSVQNLPTWEMYLISLFARLANDNIGYIDWDPYIPKIFTRILRSFHLPVGSSQILVSRYQTNAYDINHVVTWVTALLGGPSKQAQIHLNGLFNSITSFFHPSNNGQWLTKLMKLLQRLPACVVRRLQRERYRKPAWLPPVPEGHWLSEQDITDFVTSVKQPVLLAMFSKSGSLDAARALQNLALLRPELVIPPVLEKTYLAMETLTEPHQLTATLSCVIAVARSLVAGGQRFPEGPTHILPLLVRALPGVDPNDFSKCMITFQFIATFATLVPLVDCSSALQEGNDLTQVEKELCSASAEFEDFVLQFIDRCFALIDSSTLEQTREEMETEKTHLDSLVELGLSSTFTTILTQCSVEIFQVALEKVFIFATTNIFETRVAGRMAADMCRAAAKCRPAETLKLFMPHCCRAIIQLAVCEDVLNEEELDKDLLWNLQLLSQVTRVDGEKLLPYSAQLLQILQMTLHLKSKQGYGLACDLLGHTLRSMTLIYPIEYCSVPGGFRRRLPIKDWGRPGDLCNLAIQWHVPSEGEKAFVFSTLDLLLRPELQSLQRHALGEQGMSRNEILQSLSIVHHCLLGAGSLMPPLSGEPVPALVHSMVRLTETNLYTGLDYDTSRQSYRQVICAVMRRLLQRILTHSEDDTKSLFSIIKIINDLLHFRGSHKHEFESRWKSFSLVKKSMENRLQGSKQHIRALLVDRVMLQHELRNLTVEGCEYHRVHQDLINDLLSLSTSTYSQVRSKAQNVLFTALGTYNFCCRDVIPRVLEYLDPRRTDVSQQQLKGALYCLLGNHTGVCLANLQYWDCVALTWPAIVRSGFSPSMSLEKTSVVRLFDDLADKIHRQYETIGIGFSITQSCVEKAVELLNSSQPEPCVCAVSSEEEAEGVRRLEERNRDSVQKYEELIEDLLVCATDRKIPWKFEHIAIGFLSLMLRDDCPLPSPAVLFFVQSLNHDSLLVRKAAISAVAGILKQLKRPRKKVSVNPYDISELKNSLRSSDDGTEMLWMETGDRPDNRWLQYNSSRLPRSQHDWDSCCFIEKTHWGYSVWPRKLMMYAPAEEQPKQHRTREEMTESEQVIYDHFSDPAFVDQFIRYLSLEDSKGKDKFSPRRFCLFKGLFRNFGSAALPLLKFHVERLFADTHESAQRCAAEIVSGLIRGSKHWSYSKVENMWSWLCPLLRTAISNVTVETCADWGTCIATACESRDPRKLHWLFEMLMESPVKGEGGSFVDACRLYVLQGGLVQQEWRVPELLHRLLEYLEPKLTQVYKNVRERIGSVLTYIFMIDVNLPGTRPTASPRIAQFTSRVLARLRPLLETEGEIQNHVLEDSTVEQDERTQAVRLLKTVLKWLMTSTGRSFSSALPEQLQLLPLLFKIAPVENDEGYDEMKTDAKTCLSLMSQGLLYPEQIPPVLNTLRKISKSSSWHARYTVLTYLQSMVFYNLFTFLNVSKAVGDVRALVLELLEDEQLEVREMAATTLSGFLQCYFFSMDDRMQAHFKALCSTRLPKRRRRESGSMGDTVPSADLVRRHAGVLGLSACILSSPYSVPSWMPQILMDLSSHLNDMQPIEMTVKKTLSDFRRTHHDNWQEHKQQFTDDQLLVLTDLLVSPCYYA